MLDPVNAIFKAPTNEALAAVLDMLFRQAGITNNKGGFYHRKFFEGWVYKRGGLWTAKCQATQFYKKSLSQKEKHHVADF